MSVHLFLFYFLLILQLLIYRAHGISILSTAKLTAKAICYVGISLRGVWDSMEKTV